MNIENFRILSQIFSPPVFQKIVRSKDTISFNQKINSHLKTNVPLTTNKELIKEVYNVLQKRYRCEYIYKNKIFIDIIKKYGLKETTILNEFKVGASKADLILLNGTIRIYEIKTELDGLAKLEKQIRDYQKIADKIYIVTDEKYSRKLNLEYRDSNVGIISLSSKNELITLKSAESNVNYFEFDALFKLLRKYEYINLFVKNFNFIPDIPNTKIFKFCYEELKQIEIQTIQKQILEILKERNIKRPDLLKSNKTPPEIKYLCNSLDFNETEYQELYKFLNKEFLCTNLT